MGRYGGLQGGSAVRVRRIRIRAAGQQHIDGVAVSMDYRQHQGRATACIARIDADRILEQHLHPVNVADFSRLPQRGWIR